MISPHSLRGILPRGSTLFVAVSGGKDSVALLHSLWRIRGELGIRIVAYHINLGIPTFSEKSEEVVRSLSRDLGIPLVITDLERDFGFTVPEASRATGRKPCSVCGIVKRYLQNRVPRELGASAVATGHNADDFAKFALKDLYSGEALWLSKISRILASEDPLLLPKLRPLIHRTGEEILTYVEENDLPYVRERCPLAPRRDRFLEVVTVAEGIIPGFRKGLVRGAERLSKSLKPRTPPLVRCSICGEPSSTDPCSFCRLRMAVERKS